jgi:Leucine-rich repeat (LRR) protein
VKSIYKKEKEFISLIGEDINDEYLEEILHSSPTNRLKIKFLELPDNNIADTGFSFICKNFGNLTKLVLSRNKIKSIDEISTLINIEQLNIRDNQI